MIEMRVAHLGIDRSTNTPVVILREVDGERALPILIGAPEATAIAMVMQGQRPPRPLTHDLLKQVMRGLGGELRRVVITDLRDNTYFAVLFIYRDDHVFQVDARPSDSIALALRLEAPIFTDESVLEVAGKSSDLLQVDVEDAAENLRQYLRRLDPQDFGRFNP